MTGFLKLLEKKYEGLHRRYVFIGSMNLDPSSLSINTEMGAMVDSPELAEDLARIIERNMSGENAWHVQMDDKGKLSWHSDTETLNRQPARDTSQRIMNVLMKLGPKGQY